MTTPTPRPKAVELRPLGTAPVWGGPIDGDIVRYQNGPMEMQRKTFFGCARWLYDNLVRDIVPDEDRLDPSDNDEWLRRLAVWFGFDDDLRDEIIREAMRSAAEILPDEMPGAE